MTADLDDDVPECARNAYAWMSHFLTCLDELRDVAVSADTPSLCLDHMESFQGYMEARLARWAEIHLGEEQVLH